LSGQLPPSTARSAWPALPKAASPKPDAFPPEQHEEQATTAGAPRSRPPAPEVRCAEAKAQAEALEASAGVLRTAGLKERAEGLEREAAELRKKNVELPAGRRLDLAEGYASRCEARGRKAAEAVAAAKAKLLEAEALQRAADQETVDAQAQLEKLRAELGTRGVDDAMREASPDAGGEAEQRLAARVWAQEAELQQLRQVRSQAQAERTAPSEEDPELHSLRAKLRRTEEERDEALAAAQPAATLLEDSAVEAAQSELAAARLEYEAVFRAGGLPPVQELQRLADLASRLKRRTGNDPY
jgi:hypothetical protein